jgi:hypothetical protein
LNFSFLRTWHTQRSLPSELSQPASTSDLAFLDKREQQEIEGRARTKGIARTERGEQEIERRAKSQGKRLHFAASSSSDVPLLIYLLAVATGGRSR